MSNKAASNVISLPKGGGAVSGMGEKFSPDLFTGTGNFSVPVAVPPGRNGFQPDLSLSYSTGSGNSPFGLGWNLSVPGITRKTNKGIPVYDDEKDVFILSGAEDLVPVHRREETIPATGTPSEKFTITTYRPRTEGLFARIEHYKAAASGKNYWKVMSKNGLASYYGHENKTGDLNAIIADPENRRNIFGWKLTRTIDLFGNEIVYEYERELKEDGPHHFDQLYLAGIKYVDYLSNTPVSGTRKYLVSVKLEYANRPDEFSTYDSGFEIRATRRCTAIKTFTHPESADDLPEFYLDFGGNANGYALPVKTLYLNYADEITADNLPLNGSSLLAQVQVEGHGWGRSGQENELMPPLEFRYSSYHPEKQDFFPVGGSLPGGSLGNAEYELADLTGDGLPDILQLNGVARYWKNLGNGKFDLPKNMTDAPAGLQLADPDVQLIDANGDGKADLLVNREGLSGYFPLNFNGLWDKNSFRKYKQRPSFSFADPEVKLMDLDGDGITDVLRNGSRFEYFYNDPEQGFYKSQQINKKALEDFPNVSFTDSRVKVGKLCSSLQNIVMVHNGRVDYWPNLGHGRWGKRVTMKNCPRFPYSYNPARIILGDVDGDGLDDLIYVDNNKVTLWINESGNSWSEPIEIGGTPSVTDADAIRITDLLGSGVSGLLYSRDATATNQKQQYMFLDFCGGVKPYLLQEMDNNMGALTRVQYTSSTKFYTEDARKPETRWQTCLPFPVLVVHRVEVFDRISGGKMTTEYNYHHGYWDGGEREFRGFGRVDQRDTESFERFNVDGLHTRESFKPLLRERGDWLEPDFDGADFMLDKVRYLPDRTITVAGEWEPAEFNETEFQMDGTFTEPGATMNWVSAAHFSPPTETRTWFHLGPLGDEHGEWYEANFTREYWQEDQPAFTRPAEMEMLLKKLPRRAKRDAYRALRGSVLRTELYARDGSTRQNRPYTVTESLTGVAEVRTVLVSDVATPELSFNGTYPNNALNYLTEQRVFFACGLGQRTTQWERGSEPMTQFSFTGNYDAFGQAQEQISVAVPRYWNFREGKWAAGNNPVPTDHNRYLATAGVTEYAYKNTTALYFTDRVIKTTGYDASANVTVGSSVFTFKNGIENSLQSLDITGQTIHYYDGNAFTGFGYGDLGLYGALVRTEVLMLTEDIRKLAYGGSTAYAGMKPEVLETSPIWGNEYPPGFRGAYAAAFAGAAGYTFHAQNDTVHEPESYYAQAERKAYDFQKGVANPKGLALETANPLHTNSNSRKTEITYDNYQLLPVKVKDPLGLETNAKHDYRVLQPRLVTDANGNRTAARFSPLGLVHEQGILGKLNANEGDIIAEGTDFDFEASTKLDYCFFQFYEHGLPVWVKTTQREHHFAANPGNNATLVKVEYSDGFGRLLQTRAQAEDVLFGVNAFGSSGLPQNQEDTNEPAVGIERTGNAEANVLVSGWQTYNNKGKVVEKYEPFFDTGFAYKPAAPQGEKVTMYYDPRGQVVRTVNPDGTEQRVIFGIPQSTTPDTFTPTPWEQYTYDSADLGIGGTPNPDHIFTPKSALLDALGRTVQTVDRLKRNDAPDFDLATDEVVMQYEYDIRGNRTKVIDALGRDVFRHYYDLKPKAGEDDPGANVLYTWHLDGHHYVSSTKTDGSVKTSVFSAAGTVLENRDSKGALVLHAYDKANRPVKMWAADKLGEDATLRQRLEYGDSAGLTDSSAKNLNGQLYRHFDEAGLLLLEAYDFKGNLLQKTRQVLKDQLTITALNDATKNWNEKAYHTDWSNIDPATDLPNLLNLKDDYQTLSQYDALNRVTEITCPSDIFGNEKQIVLDYNRAGALEGVKLRDSDTQTEETYVERIAYNAKGQRLLIAYGNGTMTRYAYEDQTFRLQRLKTEKFSRQTERGTCLQFDGQDNYVALQNADLNAQGTLEFWFNAADTNNDRRFYANASTAVRFLWGQLQFWSGSNWHDISTSIIPVNTWTHLALVRNGSAITAYLNGKPEKPAVNLDPNAGFAAMELGNRYAQAHGTNFHGLIDEVKFWNQRLTPEQIVASMQEKNQPIVPELQYYWKFNEGNGTTAAESTGNGVAAILNGATWRVGSSSLTYSPQSGTTKQDLAYAYDLAGNITSITDRTPGCGIAGNPNGPDKLERRFTYDALYRLKTATGRETLQTSTLSGLWDDSIRPTDNTQAQAYTQGYVYDKLGNILSLVHTATGGFTRTFNYQTPHNKLQSVAIGSGATYSYTYDANGNQLTENQNRYFEWDYADRLRAFYNQATAGNEPSVYAAYHYDAGGQRVKKITRKQGGTYEVTVYIDGLFEHQYKGVYDSFAKEIVPSDEKTFLHVMDDQKRIATIRVRDGADPDDPTPNTKYFLDDHLGSSSVVLDNAGLLVNREEYYPFGETSFGSFAKKRYRFCGKERDEESGLYYYGARYYAPWICRFVSVDPLAEDRDWINSYNYVQNNPLGRIDPSGASDTKYEDEAGNLLLETKDGSDAVVTVSNKKLSEFTKNIKSSRVHGMESVYDSKGWNDYWKEELLGFKLSNAQESALHSLNSDWSRKQAIKFWQNPSLSTSFRFSFAEAMSQWTNPELVIGGLSAGAAGYPKGGIPKVSSTPKAAGAAKFINKPVTNPIPKKLARIVPADIEPKTLGHIKETDVFVTAAEDIAGLNAEEIAKKLTIPYNKNGFKIIEFNTPESGLSSPINRNNPGFVGFGRTTGGAREFVIPNQPIPKGSTIRTVN